MGNHLRVIPGYAQRKAQVCLSHDDCSRDVGGASTQVARTWRPVIDEDYVAVDVLLRRNRGECLFEERATTMLAMITSSVGDIESRARMAPCLLRDCAGGDRLPPRCVLPGLAAHHGPSVQIGGVYIDLSRMMNHRTHVRPPVGEGRIGKHEPRRSCKRKEMVARWAVYDRGNAELRSNLRHRSGRPIAVVRNNPNALDWVVGGRMTERRIKIVQDVEAKLLPTGV